MTYSFSQRSLDKLKECHEDLQVLMLTAIKTSPYDFGITWGYRSPVKQNELYQQGRDKNGNIISKKDVITYVDGYDKKSKHNYNPSHAVDIICYINGKHTWDSKIYKKVATNIMDIAEDLFLSGAIKNRIIWGGNWNKLKDWPHFQI